MISSHEVIKLIDRFSLAERLLIVEEVLKKIRQEKLDVKPTEPIGEREVTASILSFAGILDNEEAEVWYGAIDDEARKIDYAEWERGALFSL